ncbi:MAG TPA: hypothetical protein PKC30_02235 [Saprospiraceae bacterium]|nr:hypothetical protein [Saprospiraceae bacterium]
MNRHHEIYLHFYKIDKSSYQDKVRFFEKHKEQLTQLSFHEGLEMKADYAFALFELGKYYPYLKLCDELIETVIMENILRLNGKNIFEELLFRKAASLYNLRQFDDAIKIAREIIAINPANTLAANLLRQSLRLKGYKWYEVSKGIAVVFLLSGISVVVAELFVVDPFYETYAFHVRIFRISLFVIAGVLLLFNEIAIRAICFLHVNKYAHKIERKRTFKI